MRDDVDIDWMSTAPLSKCQSMIVELMLANTLNSREQRPS
jgi:hypothetical protein